MVLKIIDCEEIYSIVFKVMLTLIWWMYFYTFLNWKFQL